ncbi:YhdP family phospholipid transporter [Thiomicrorhabdus chilensis]|uniref:YhdP family phospholipid transporter n=1 Tax=Thiomicrorhabdus chilensis TaxID=63656 RepID=UPI0003F52AD9|nr:DUF3971 domain-containing protein [Thiomicrorhabdus chilensis]
MIRRTHQLLFVLFALFVAYLLVVRLLISWAQWAPNQFGSVVETFTDTEIVFQDLDIDQNWMGVTVHAKELLVEHRTFEFEAGRISIDLNVFSPLIPQMSWGDFLEVENLILWEFQPKQGESALKKSSQPVSLESVEALFAKVQLNRLWKRVNISELSASIRTEGNPFKINVETFQAYKGANWSMAADFTLSYGSSLQEEVFQFKGSFLPNVWGRADRGRFSLTSFEPLELEGLARLLPDKWHDVIPEGELTVDVSGEMAGGRLSDATIELYAQALQWPDSVEALPKTLGVDLAWQSPSKVYGERDVKWHFSASQLQIDNQYIETVAPIELSFAGNRNLSFTTKRFDIEPFKRMVHAILKNENVADLFDASVELSLQDIEGELDVDTLVVENLSMEISKLSVPVTNLPGLAMEQIFIDKRGNDFQVIVDKPFWVMEPRLHPVPMRFQIKNRLKGKLNFSESEWQVSPLKMTWDEMPVQISAHGDFFGGLESQLSITPDSMQKVKDYLPYGLMSEKLQAWLKNALLAGEELEGQFYFNGNLNDYPFTEGETTFGGEVSVKNARLKFQPKWPELSGLDAKITFTPYRLEIASDKVTLTPGLAAKDVRVLIDDLHTKNIAVHINGMVSAPAEKAMAYFLETPLPAKLGVNELLSDQDKIALSGKLQLDLQDIWIPVHGFAGRDETVSGKVTLSESKLRLYDQFVVDKIAGVIQFTEQSVNGQNLKAVVEKGDADFNIRTDLKAQKVEITGNGVAEPDYPTLLDGQVGWKSVFTLPLKKQDQTNLTAEIELDSRKAQWKMPAPLNQEALSGLTKLNVVSQSEQTRITGSVESLGVFIFQINEADENKKRVAGAINLGMGETQALLSNQAKVSVNGQLPLLDLDGWIQWQAPGKEEGTEWLEPIVWAKSSLTFNSVQLFNETYPAMNLTWQGTQNNQISFNSSADYLNAVAQLQGDHQLDISVSKLHLNLPDDTFTKTDVDEQEAEQKIQACKAKTPSIGTWPRINFSGQNLSINDKLMSSMRFELEDGRNALHFKDLKVVFANGAGVLDGQYFFHKVPKQSSAVLKVTSSNVKSLTRLIGLKQGFSGKKADLKANLAWSGGLECFDLLGLTGQTGFEIRDGVVDDVEPGFARLLGLLNVTSIARRLSLNLKDVTTKGMAYDNIKGKALFKDGLLQLDGFKMRAPSASVDLFGNVDLIQREFKLKAEVTPALGSSLPALSAITGVATPLGALAIYALMKVIPDINEDLVTYRYDVTGPWAKPVIKERNGQTKPQEVESGVDELLN